MRRCPKCNSNNIAGPRYEREHGVERLNYRCIQCGYSASTQTADARGDRPVLPPDLARHFDEGAN